MKTKKNPALFFRSGACVVLGLALFLPVAPVLLGASPLLSSRWGFRIDPPEEYQFSEGDGKNRFSFRSPEGALLDLVVYAGDTYPSVEAVAEDVQRRLNNRGEISSFEYRTKKAALMALQFSRPGSGNRAASQGWGLCIELEGDTRGNGKPLLLALAYGPEERRDLQGVFLSALDSIIPTPLDSHAPGPITEFSYPRGEQKQVRLAGGTAEALIAEHDVEAAQALVDREFAVLRRYAASPLWQEAWTRFYRAIYRDSFDRLANAAFALERYWNTQESENRKLAEKALGWVQSFTYERDFMGSDFVNLVSAAVEGRGDCDSRALLWAIMLEQANIPAAIMVSRDYSHAMGLADLPGTGARFDLQNKQWLVAETTAPVALGLIGQSVSDISNWLGVVFE
ncbi:MAG: hypothetical protein LBT14_04410 [Treponema sp.]|jgi:hypothetical protein|nr:hypothetical protein [Treponema sp.]